LGVVAEFLRRESAMPVRTEGVNFGSRQEDTGVVSFDEKVWEVEGGSQVSMPEETLCELEEPPGFLRAKS
jgi:hypothetical protein